MSPVIHTAAELGAPPRFCNTEGLRFESARAKQNPLGIPAVTRPLNSDGVAKWQQCGGISAPRRRFRTLPRFFARAGSRPRFVTVGGRRSIERESTAWIRSERTTLARAADGCRSTEPTREASEGVDHWGHARGDLSVDCVATVTLAAVAIGDPPQQAAECQFHRGPFERLGTQQPPHRYPRRTVSHRRRCATPSSPATSSNSSAPSASSRSSRAFGALAAWRYSRRFW